MGWLTVFGQLTDDGSVRELMSHIFRMDEPELNERLVGYGLESHQFNLKKYNELVEERNVVLIKNPRTIWPLTDRLKLIGNVLFGIIVWTIWDWSLNWGNHISYKFWNAMKRFRIESSIENELIILGRVSKLFCQSRIPITDSCISRFIRTQSFYVVILAEFGCKL